MAVNRRIFTDEFKAKAVRLVTVEGHPARQVARDLDIHESLLLWRWQRKLAARQARAAGVSPSATVAAAIIVEQEEIRKLKRENERLWMERDILINYASQTGRGLGEGMARWRSNVRNSYNKTHGLCHSIL
jgi:transposase